MPTTPQPPVIFTAFANPHGDLPNLTREQNGIQDVLASLESQGLLAKHLVRTDTDRDAYFRFLKVWENRVTVFHYAGHANSAGISLQDAHTFFEPLAEELVARNRKSLRLVVLNGCSTVAHVQTLLDLGVPAVIATFYEVKDEMATDFALFFYQNLSGHDSLQTAYASAARYVRRENNSPHLRYFGEVRNAGFDQPKAEATAFPWSLYVTEANDDVLQEVLIPASLAQKIGPTPSEFTAGVWADKYLSTRPFPPPELMADSRDDVLAEILTRTADAPKTLVLYAHGGAGKTSILAKFNQQHGHRYPHVVWISCGNHSLAQAFADSDLAEHLRPSLPGWRDDLTADQKFDLLVAALAAEGRSGLLLLDNANHNAQLHHYRKYFVEKLDRWTCLITSRDEKSGLHMLRVPALPAEFARMLFVQYWLEAPTQIDPADADLLERLLERIGHHALLTEVLARHLHTRRDEGKTDLLADLVKKLSTEGILGLPRTDGAEVAWQGAVGTPQQILLQLFDLTALDEDQQTLLLRLSLLPSEPWPMRYLLPILGIEEGGDAEETFTAQVSDLAHRGWLEFFVNQGYRVHPLVAEVSRKRLLPDFERCRLVVENLRSILENWKITDAKALLPAGVGVLENLGFPAESAVSFLTCVTGDGFQSLGDLPRAQMFFEKYLEISERLALPNPDSEDIQSDWAVANSRLGDLSLSLGGVAEARRFFEKYLEISERLALVNPDSETIQREWAVANSKMGDLSLSLGGVAEARRFFEKNLEISERLTLANPDSETIQRDWAVANSRLGDLSLSLGVVVEARRFLEKYLEISERLALDNPDSETIQREWAVANAKMGDLSLSLGGVAEARRLFEKTVEIFERLALVNPDSETIQRDWAVANSKMGDLSLSLGAVSEARRFFEKRREISERLALANPDSEDIQREWAVALAKLGSWGLQNEDNPVEARRLLEQSLGILETRLAINPVSVDLQKQVENVRSWLA